MMTLQKSNSLLILGICVHIYLLIIINNGLTSVQAAPTQLQVCIMKAAVAVSTLAIPPEVSMLERKDPQSNNNIPDPVIGKVKHYKRAIEKFVIEVTQRLNVGGDCGNEFTAFLEPNHVEYNDRVALTHADLDYIIGLSDMAKRWMGDKLRVDS